MDYHFQVARPVDGEHAPQQVNAANASAGFLSQTDE
jgi:hypothetical protein